MVSFRSLRRLDYLETKEQNASSCADTHTTSLSSIAAMNDFLWRLRIILEDLATGESVLAPNAKRNRPDLERSGKAGPR